MIEITEKSQVINDEGYAIEFSEPYGFLEMNGNEEWCLGANADTAHIFPSFDSAMNFAAVARFGVNKFTIKKIKRTSIIELD